MSEASASLSSEGTVVRQHLGHYFVSTDAKIVDCAISSRLRKRLEYPQASPGSRRKKVESVRRIRSIDPVAIGDRVRFEAKEGQAGLIREVLPRRNKISRTASGTSGREQTLAANIDQVVPIISAGEPAPDWELLDRMLGIAEWQEVLASVCLNKMDLVEEDLGLEAMAPYEQVGYPVVYTSVVSDLGLEPFRELLRGKTTLFMGASGVGKTSLLNWLEPGLSLRTGEVSETTGEGKHTTSHLELVSLKGGGLVGDIPGVREFQLWGIEPFDVPFLFREFRDLEECRFRDCAHIHEPGCGVKHALEEAKIHARRYESYVQIRGNP